MQKIFMGVLVLLVSSVAFAADEFPGCYQKIASLERTIPSLEQLACGSANPQFEGASSVLCSPDLGEASAKYQTYLGYKAEHAKAWSEFQAAYNTPFRSAALIAVTKIERDWKLFGYREEVAAALGTLIQLSSVSGCVRPVQLQTIPPQEKPATNCSANGCVDKAGCNRFGCWAPGGGCNEYGCWSRHGQPYIAPKSFRNDI